jgi:hypothetical protein
MRVVSVFLFGLFSMVLAGCGESFGEVEGNVVLKGQKVPSGVVTFFPAEGSPTATFIQDGKYSARLLYGQYKISVTEQTESPEVTTAGGKPMKPGESAPQAAAPAAAKKSKKTPINPKFGSIDSSGLTVKVDKSKVSYPISLD